ncbi:MAG: hypothetical protein IJ012_05685 [Clostridia bacterium]|nr:hypothetical protein [Clostridia bacterium]
MKSATPSIEFISPLSELEVRMALRELCGSKWDDCPFRGEVDKNSFRLIKNSVANTRGIPKPILVGDFYEQNGKTKVTISMQPRRVETIGVFIWILAAAALAGDSFVSMLHSKGFVSAFISAAILAGVGVGAVVLSESLLRLSFQRSAEKIKNLLGDISLNCNK